MLYRKFWLAAGLGCLASAPGVAAPPSPPSESATAAPARVLGNAQQIAFEKAVLKALESAAMKAEIQRVEALYAADPQGATPTGKATILRAAHAIAAAAASYAVGEDTDRPAAHWVVNAPHTWGGITTPRSGYGIDNPDNVYGFPAMANHNAFFNGRAPLEIMAQGDMISLYETYRRIDALRSAQW